MDRKQIIHKWQPGTEHERGARFYIWCRGLHHKYKGLAYRETFCVDDYNITIALFDYAFGWMWLYKPVNIIKAPIPFAPCSY